MLRVKVGRVRCGKHSGVSDSHFMEGTPVRKHGTLKVTHQVLSMLSHSLAAPAPTFRTARKVGAGAARLVEPCMSARLLFLHCTVT